METFVATSRYDPTYDPGAVHPFGHVLSLDGQGHLPVRCDCQPVTNDPKAEVAG